MARAQHQLNWQDRPAQARDEWNNLRDELETLLDQVHERQNQLPSEPPLHLPPLPEDAASTNPDQRRQDALLSVRRAVQRFNEQEEAPDMSAQSPERLQSAIEQIRASQNRSFQRSSAPARRAEPTTANAFADLKSAMGEISERMTRFETLLEGRAASGGMVEEIAQQMEQMTSVVEMLATSVGEQSHIKRIEGQIARLAENVNSGPDIDIDTFSERLEVLSQAFERLSSLQAEPQLEIPDYSHHLSALDSGVRLVSDRMRDLNFDAMESGLGKVSAKLDSMDFTAIEACVRSVYDRIDVLENNLAVPTPAIERLTRDLAEFTEVMKNGKGPVVTSTLVTRVDALNARLSEIEDGGPSVDGLKFDMEALRQTVASAIEPRFSAIETQLGSLSDQFGAPSPHDASHSIAGLEDQIKRLADRLDQTGEELTQLQSLYADAPQFPEMPDFSALADMVANRAQSALAESAKAHAPSVAPTGLQVDDLRALEQRLSELFWTQRSETAAQDLSTVEQSLNSVHSRLQSLEEMLSRAEREPHPSTLSRDSTPAAHLAATADSVSAPVGEFDLDELEIHEGDEIDEFDPSSGRRHLHPGLDVEPTPDVVTAKPSQLLDGLRDTMPRPPTDEAPLNAPAFPEPQAEFEDGPETGRVPVPDSLKADDDEFAAVDNSPRDELDSDNKFDVDSGPIRSHVAPESDGPPPPPTSAFASDSAQVPTSAPVKTPMRDGGAAKTLESNTDDESASSRSTFIAAARRAAQQNNPQDAADSGAQSLFGKALARFQQKRETGNGVEAEPEVTPPELDAEPDITKPAAKGSLRSKFKIPRITKDVADVPIDELDDLTVKESVLTKYRRPILLGAAVVAVSLLTLNLVSHRLSASDGSTNTASANMLGIPPAQTPEMAEDVEQQDAIERPINGADEVATNSDFPVGSIGEMVAPSADGVRVIDPTPMAEMPAPLALASFTPELATDAPAPVGLPEGLGPISLRNAAQNGDARAQFEVAAIFAEGRAVTQNLAESAGWYERSAAQGFAPAAYRLGNMYENGAGVDIDLVKAQFWYEKAASYGNRMSMHNLASILAGGALGEQNFPEAAVWFEKAAGLGLTDSQFNLGMLYARGLGVSQDLASSYKWFALAAEAGDADAIQARDDIARSLDAETVSRLQAELANWSPQQINIPANFAPIGTWDDAFDPGPKIENRDIIERVQTALNKLGFDTGNPDGMIGPKTHDAVNAFEAATGMTQSGEINPRLLAVLGSQPV